MEDSSRRGPLIGTRSSRIAVVVVAQDFSAAVVAQDFSPAFRTLVLPRAQGHRWWPCARISSLLFPGRRTKVPQPAATY